MSKEVIITDEKRAQIQKFISELHLDVTGPGGKTVLSEEYIIRIVTRFAVSICTAWWSMRELFDYIHNRKSLNEFVKNDLS